MLARRRWETFGSVAAYARLSERQVNRLLASMPANYGNVIRTKGRAVFEAPELPVISLDVILRETLNKLNEQRAD